MKKKLPRPRTRRVIQEILKSEGPTAASILAERLQVSAMAVRQHLYELQEQKLVTFEEAPQSVGRPLKLWKLTEEANAYFPDCHADLTVNLIESIQGVFGAEGMDKLLQVRARRQIESYKSLLGGAVSLSARLKKLAGIRSREGYMATVEREGRGRYLFIENHCPICSAAKCCTGLCAAEMQVFKSVLGDDVSIERVEHILDGSRRCAYRMENRSA